MLLALQPNNWEHLVATAPSPSCTAPLERIRRASLELLYPHPHGNQSPLLGNSMSPGHSDADGPSTKRHVDNVHVTNEAKGTAKKTPDDYTNALQAGSENSGASKLQMRAASVGEGRRNHGGSSDCVFPGNRPVTAEEGLADGV